MNEQVTSFSIYKKAGLLLFSLILVLSFSGCAVEETDPLVVPYSDGPDGPPSVEVPDEQPPASG